MEAAISATSKHPVFTGSIGSFIRVRFSDYADYHDSKAIPLHPRAFFYDPIEVPEPRMSGPPLLRFGAPSPLG
jgi:hypothetical protein